MQVELSEEQARELERVLEAHLGDLSMEIAGTDNPRFRNELRQARDILAQVRLVLHRAHVRG